MSRRLSWRLALRLSLPQSQFGVEAELEALSECECESGSEFEAELWAEFQAVPGSESVFVPECEPEFALELQFECAGAKGGGCSAPHISEPQIH